MARTEQPELVVADATAWRRWLEKHHTEPAGVWLVLAKKGVVEPTSLSYAAALEEAVCFGWIDGQVRRRDEATYSERFTPRRARSKGSQHNVALVARLDREGRMHAAGFAEVERAKADGRWEAAYAGQATAQVPDDLATAISTSPRAQAMFEVLTGQNRYALIYRVAAAKKPANRAAKIEQLVAMLERGETVYPQKRRPVDFG